MKENFSMDKYKNFSVEDFLQDEFFSQWVKNPFTKDAELWERWIDSNRDMEKIVDEAKKIILAFEYQPRPLPGDFYTKLKSRIDTTNNNIKDDGAKFFFKAHWLKLVALFAGLIVAASMLVQHTAEEEFLTYRSKYAETKKIVLPDGSEVVLNANSTLEYKNNDKDSCREVWLKGEGYFSIKPSVDAQKNPLKFIVHTQDINVEVLGTQFNVNSNEGGKTAVLLTKGKVRLKVVEGAKQPMSMAPGDLVEYNNITKRMDVNKVSPANYVAWKEHKYIFEKASLEEVSRVLHRYYGKSFTIMDSAMRTKRLSGTLELQDEDILIETLSVLLGVPVNKNDNQIIISSE